MATKKKMLQAAAGQAGGAGLDITDVFSTYLLDNSGTVVNGIDLAGEGGLLWTKHRSGGALSFYQNHFLYDTERGYGSTDYLHSNNTDAAGATGAIASGSFNSDGFTTGGNIFGGNEWASWTFRKAPKFFDVVTYTGDGDFTGRTIPHSLGSVPGMILIKKTSGAADWIVYHRSEGATKYLELNNTNASNTYNMFNDTDPTSTEFYVSSYSKVNENGATYVAYLFAHNDGDGGFGPSGDQDIIKCGSLTTNSDGSLDLVDLGFEPQWLLIKNSSTTGNWEIHDVMRDGTLSTRLRANLADAEVSYSSQFLKTEATGFSAIAGWGGISNTKVYMAIRRGPLAQPESGTEVFDTVTGSGVQSTGFPVDFLIGLNNRTNTESYDPFVKTRLLGGASYLTTSSTAAEASGSDVGFDTMDGLTYSWPNSNAVAWNWKRAPGFFDAVAFSGTGVAGRTVSHNLGVAPEMMWVKVRDLSSGWPVWHTGKELYLNSNTAKEANPWSFNNTDPTATSFTLNSYNSVNGSGYDYIAYLFATLPGVSKVGSYAGNSGTQTIDCGFTSGARFILVKRTDSTGDWYVWDTERGIVSGNDPYLRLNRDLAEETTQDDVDPQSSGFIVNQGANNLNQSGGSYIFYAIA